MPRRSPLAPPALVHPLFMVLSEPPCQISLEVRQGGVKLLANRKARELRAQGLRQPLDEALRLRTLPRGAGMIDIFHGQVQLILVGVGTATVLSPPIGHKAAQRYFVGVTEGPHLVIEQSGGG